MGNLYLFMSVSARENPVDGGGSYRLLKSTSIEDARIEAQAIIEERAPKDGYDFFCDFAVIVRASEIDVLRNGF